MKSIVGKEHNEEKTGGKVRSSLGAKVATNLPRTLAKVVSERKENTPPNEAHTPTPLPARAEKVI